MKKILLLLLSLLFISCHQSSKSNDYKLFVTLENAPFDSLYLLDYTEGRYEFFLGEKIDKYTWRITIPDSIVWNSTNMILKTSKYAYLSNSSKGVRFISEKNGKKNMVVNIGVEDREDYIHATYIGKTIFPNEYFSVKIGGKDSIMLGDVINEDFRLIHRDDNSTIAVRSQEPYFSRFFNSNNEEISYDEYLIKYIELSEKYPGSRYLMSELSCMLHNYKSKEDVQLIYGNLSLKHKKTLWAERIERYLSTIATTKFSNLSLPTSDKETYEEIIQDTSKYNLVVFTASWCGYCIKEIPILKKMYKDLSGKIILTYVSLDEESEISSFKNIIYEKGIPWRTLFAYKVLDEVKDKYLIGVKGIPLCILVHPNGEMETIEIRDNEQLKNVYLLCNSI